MEAGLMKDLSTNKKLNRWKW